MPSTCWTRLNSSTAKATSAGPCILGVTTYMEPAGEFARRPPLCRYRGARSPPSSRP